MVKLLISYDPIPEVREDYFQYILGEFIPTMEKLGLTICEAWHTAYGAYPLRLTGFTAPDRDTMDQVLTSEDFKHLEQRLQAFVINYDRRVVPEKKTFQF
jgi:hypothetical protein